MIKGYGRVSTMGQSLDAQKQELLDAGAEVLYLEKFTGTTKDRPELERLLDELVAGDMVIVTKLDRIARNTRDGIDIVNTVIDKGCSIRILNMGMFDDTPTGRLMLNVLLAFAEFERDMIVQRTQEGKAIARKQEGYKEGRPRIEVDILPHLERVREGIMTVDQAIKILGISKRTWYNRVKEEGLS